MNWCSNFVLYFIEYYQTLYTILYTNYISVLIISWKFTFQINYSSYSMNNQVQFDPCRRWNHLPAHFNWWNCKKIEYIDRLSDGEWFWEKWICSNGTTKISNSGSSKTFFLYTAISTVLSFSLLGYCCQMYLLSIEKGYRSQLKF